jgi:serine/threonine protein kinase
MRASSEKHTPNDTWGAYRLIGRIATTKVFEVWEVEHLRQHLRCAMKLMLPQGSGDRHWINALKREYVVGRQLKHACVIETRDFGVENGLAYLVMELCMAPNLKQWMHEVDTSSSPFLPRVIETAAQALQYLHAQGWIHRDIKPENFLVGEKGATKLIDFTLTKRRPSWLSQIFTGYAKTQGTPSYMSPEQIRNKLQDQRSDIYSFGCVVFEIATGKPPYSGSTANELLTKHLRAAVPSLRLDNPRISEQFSHAVQQLLAKRPAERPASMDHVITSLTKIEIYNNT